MMKKTLLVTCLCAFLASCSEGPSSSGLNGFDGFSLSSAEPVAGAAQPGTDGANPSVVEGVAPPAAASSVVENEQSAVVSETTNVDTTATIDASPFVESISTTSGDQVLVPDSDSSKITTRSDFLFDTSRTIQLKVNMQDVGGTQGSLSICTDFQETASGFDINYQSCPIRGTVSNGQFEQDMSLMNQYDSVVAVIWFRNQEFAPRYRKFDTADFVEGAQTREWIWN